MDEILSEQHVFIGLDAATQEDVFRAVAHAAAEEGITESAEKLYVSFAQRERVASTGLMDGFAIPHAKTSAVHRAALYFVRTNNALPWETMDGSRVSNLFFLIAPEDASDNPHLTLLSALASCLLDDEFKRGVIGATTPRELVSLVRGRIKKEVR